MAFDFDVVGKKTFGPYEFACDWQRAAVYALGCGATTDELDLVLEARGPKVLPTFSVVPAHAAVVKALLVLGGNMLTLVHGTQKCRIHKPIPPEGVLKTTSTVSALFDKGKGALGVLETKTTDGSGDLICETEWGIFFRGEGGFGGERGPEAPKYEPPEGKAPDHTVAMPTADTQALLYRLGSGDLNPIHSDPKLAAKAKFPKPILHGLCTFGHAGRAVVNSLMGGDPDKVKTIEGRFSKPVFPGDTIVTDIWNIADGEAFFTVKVQERDEQVLSLGRVTYAE